MRWARRGNGRKEIDDVSSLCYQLLMPSFIYALLGRPPGVAAVAACIKLSQMIVQAAWDRGDKGHPMLMLPYVTDHTIQFFRGRKVCCYYAFTVLFYIEICRLGFVV